MGEVRWQQGDGLLEDGMRGAGSKAYGPGSRAQGRGRVRGSERAEHLLAMARRVEPRYRWVSHTESRANVEVHGVARSVEGVADVGLKTQLERLDPSAGE